MKIFTKSKGDQDLTKRYYVTSGGEGDIYAKNGIVYKIYLKGKQVIPNNKIKELSKISLKNIITPKEMILTSTNPHAPIGYTMNQVKKTISLCQIFPKAFKDRNNIGTKEILKLVNQLRNGIKHCHSKQILLVDINEMNFLIDDSKFKQLYFIDTDSYQTSHYPATAIMDSIRDRKIKKFSEQTDWFSFAVIAFQMFMGVHPYKGKHSNYKTLDERMLNDISVFNKEVTVPKIVPSTNIIPKNYLSWLKEILENGKRIDPPFTDSDMIVSITKAVIKLQSKHFTVNVIKEVPENIIELTKEGILTTKGFYLGPYSNSKIDIFVASYSMIFKTPKYNYIISAVIIECKLLLYNITTGKKIKCDIDAESMFVSSNNLFLKQSDFILKVNLSETNQVNCAVTTNVVANIINNSTTVINGGIIQRLLGETFLSFFPDGGHYSYKAVELNKYRIINGVIHKNVAIIIGERSGKYDRFIFKFNKDYFTCTRQTKTSNTNINFIMLDNNVCVTEDEDNDIELFSGDINKNDVKIVKDSLLTIGKLSTDGNTVYNIIQNKIYSITLQKGT